MAKIDIRLPALHPAQAEVLASTARFLVCVAGRRWGKSLAGRQFAITAALKGSPVCWISPTYRMLGETWRELGEALRPAITVQNASDHRIALQGGGSIEMWSGTEPDTIRGGRYGAVVVDEAAMVPGLLDIWQRILRPTLADLTGRALFISSPRGHNDFKVLHDYGQDPGKSEWQSWQFPTSTSPYIAAAEIESARQDASESQFAAEWLAEFTDSETAVFRNVLACVVASTIAKPFDRREYCFGLDFARSTDYTVCTVLDVAARQCVFIDRYTKLTYAVQLARIKALYDLWKPTSIIGESNSMGGPLVEQLARDGVRIRPFHTSQSSKAQAIESLALSFERQAIKIPNDKVLISELLAYSQSMSANGLPKYGAPNGMHDDTVMSLALGWSVIDGVMKVQSHPRAMWINSSGDDYERPTHEQWLNRQRFN